MLERNTNKSLSQVLDKAFDSFSMGTCCVKIGKIVSFNKENQTADIQVLHKFTNPDNFINRELIEYPILKSVPCVILGGGQSHITFPISQGDNCLLLFCDHEIDNWWISGEPRPSTFNRKHNFSDSFAIVGVHSIVDLIKGYSQFVDIVYNGNSKISVGNNIEITNANINLNGKTTANDLHSKTGATGTFTNVSGQTLTIIDGIITKIS